MDGPHHVRPVIGGSLSWMPRLLVPRAFKIIFSTDNSEAKEGHDRSEILIIQLVSL